MALGTYRMYLSLPLPIPIHRLEHTSSERVVGMGLGVGGLGLELVKGGVGVSRKGLLVHASPYPLRFLPGAVGSLRQRLQGKGPSCHH